MTDDFHHLMLRRLAWACLVLMLAVISAIVCSRSVGTGAPSITSGISTPGWVAFSSAMIVMSSVCFELLANLAAYLVSPQAAYINGEMVAIDGGAHLRTSGAEDLLQWTPAQWDALRRR